MKIAYRIGCMQYQRIPRGCPAILQRLKTRLSGVKHRALDACLDFFYSIDTRSAPGEQYSEREDRHGYEPVDWKSLRQVLRLLEPKPSDAFLDIGSGKGRALLIAAGFPFQRIIGVESNRALCEVSRKNIQRYFRDRPEQRERLSVHCSDVLDFEISPDITFIYLFNPFTDIVMQGWLRKLGASLAARKHKITIIYRAPAYTDALERVAHRNTRILAGKLASRYHIYEIGDLGA